MTLIMSRLVGRTAWVRVQLGRGQRSLYTFNAERVASTAPEEVDNGRPTAPAAAGCLSGKLATFDASTPVRKNLFRLSNVTQIFRATQRRAYATKGAVSRPKAHTGRSSAKKGTKSSGSVTGKSKTKRTGAKKSTAATKTKAKPKAKPKKKTVKKAKKAKKVKKPKKPKKPMTAEERERRKRAVYRAKILALHDLALKSKAEDRIGSAWTSFLANNLTSGIKTGGPLIASKTYKSLSAEEREDMANEVSEKKANQTKALSTFIGQHSPKEILVANAARRRLVSMLRKKKARGVRISNRPGDYLQLQDDRQVKRPASAYLLFAKDQFGNFESRGLKPQECVSEIAKLWKTTPKDDKDRYMDLSEKDKQRYFTEREKVYGLKPDETLNLDAMLPKSPAKTSLPKKTKSPKSSESSESPKSKSSRLPIGIDIDDDPDFEVVYDESEAKK